MGFDLTPGVPFFGGPTAGVQQNTVESLLQTALVSRLAKRGEPLAILEIGSWLGFSALTWAHAIERFAGNGSVLCVDPWEPYFSQDDVEKFDPVYRVMNDLLASGEAYRLFRHNAGCSPLPINHRRGRSADILPHLPSESFDLVYIDGSHYYDAVLFDVTQAKRLVKDGGIICGDDLELHLSQVDEGYARANLASDYALDPKTGKSFHPGVTLAVGEALGDVGTSGRLWFAQRSGHSFDPFDPRQQQLMICPHWTSAMKKHASRILTPASS